MAEGYNFQTLTGIVKVIRPNGKPVLGIADGKGSFLWLPTEKIIMSHPMQFENWQTTIFALDPTWKIIWKAEQKWEEFKGSYPANTKPILQPIPQMFQQAAQALQTAQQTIAQPITATPPTNYPQPSTTAPVNYPQQTTTVPTVPQVPNVPTVVNFSSTPDTLQTIAIELANIRKLLELYIRPPKLKTADDLLITEEQVAEQYGAPPEENVGTKVNKDVLPKIF